MVAFSGAIAKCISLFLQLFSLAKSSFRGKIIAIRAVNLLCTPGGPDYSLQLSTLGMSKPVFVMYTQSPAICSATVH